MRRTWVWLLAVLVGAVAGFFLIGPVVFADGPAAERWAALGIAAVVFALVGGLTGYLAGAPWSGLLVGAPAVLVAWLLGEEWALRTLAGIIPLGAATAGSWAGARRRRR